MVQISTLFELVDYGAKAVESKVKWDDAELLDGCATISIKASGKKWDKSIDARGAKYILDLQKKINELYESFEKEYPLGPPLVKVRVEEGSCDLLGLFEPLIREGVSKLSPEQIFAIIKYAIFCVTGYLGVGKVLKYKESKDATIKEKELSIKILENSTETQLESLRVLEKTVDKIYSVMPEDPVLESKYEQPIRSYADSLDRKDSLNIANTVPMKQSSAKVALRARRRPPSRTRWVPCDTAFICLGIDLEQKDPRLKLQQEDILITAFLGRLEDDERISLMKRVDERVDKRQMPFRLNLQLDVYFNDTGIKYATVVGVGASRDELKQYRLSDIPKNVTTAYDEFSEPDKNDEK